MARALRILFPGAWYHVMNQGLNRQSIFMTDHHRKMFLNILSEVSEKYQIEIHAYCLIDNQYQLMVKTPEGNLSQAIHYLDTVYAIRLNKLLGREGPVFNGRFKAVLVQEGSHLLHLSRYIHRRPLQLKMVKKAEYYQWSSYKTYVGKSHAPIWLSTGFLLHHFDKRGSVAYQSFVEKQHSIDLHVFFTQRPTLLILGTDSFKKEIKQKVVRKKNTYKKSTFHFCKKTYDLENIIDIIVKITGQTRATIFTSTRGRRNYPRLMFMYISRYKCGYKIKEVRDFMGLRCPTTITMGVKRVKIFLKEDSLFKDQLELCLAQLISLFKSHEEK